MSVGKMFFGQKTSIFCAVKMQNLPIIFFVSYYLSVWLFVISLKEHAHTHTHTRTHTLSHHTHTHTHSTHARTKKETHTHTHTHTFICIASIF
jgi:hypothetical protein